MLTERDRFDESLANLQVGVFFEKKELRDFIANYFVTDLNESDDHTDSETEMAARQRVDVNQDGKMRVSIVSDSGERKLHKLIGCSHSKDKCS